MSYLVLARKWRPQSFADVVGQQAVVRTLQNALLMNRVAHAMIFSGVRGVGKTTLARIMAKAINCLSEDDTKPCNECESCKEITAGSAVDLHEIDGASNRGIQEIRELKENIRFFPTKSHCKIIIIDEVHMLTTEAFNALLKTLEEPPEHVFFMFATTELHKVPVTILSRCQRYELKRVSFDSLLGFFRKISDSEKVKISDRALEFISREADGSVRDGLSLLDQVFSFGGQEVTDEDVVQVLGLVDRKIFSSMATALLAGDLAHCFHLLEKTYGAGIDLKRFSTDLLDYFRSLLVCSTSKNPHDLLEISDKELQELQDLSGRYNAETLSHLFQVLFKGISEMQYSSHPRLVLEMAFIKAVQSAQVIPAASLLARLDEVIKKSGGQLQMAPPSVSSVISQERYSSPEKIVEKAPPEENKMVALAPPVVEPSVEISKQLSADRQEKKKDPVTIQPQMKDVRKNWEDFTAYVKERKPWMAQALRLCENPKEQDAELLVRFDNPSDTTLLSTKENLKDLTEYAQDFFQKELRVKIVTRSGKEKGDDDSQSGPQEERRALANDPLVQMTTDIFGGQVAAIRTGPRFR